jgi:hypothetical protein
VSRARSSSGVDLTVRGWCPGFDKVRFTQLLRDGGLPLGEAIDATARLLAGHQVALRLTRTTEPETLARAFDEIGVAESSTARAEAG